MAYFGVDLSKHNGTVDWNTLAKHVDFAIIRIGWCGDTENELDVKFAENYAAAKKAGVKLGGYVYMYTETPAAAEKCASWVLSQIKGKTFELPIYCDMEDESIAKLSKTTLSNIATKFCDKIASGGYAVGIYANKYWFTEKLNKNLRSKYHTWIAHYTSGTDKYKGEFEMWQNSSTGHVDGVKGNVDTNYLYVDIFKKTAAPKPSAPAPKPTTHKGYSNGAEYFNGDYRYGKQYQVTAHSGLRLRSKAGNGTILTVMPFKAKVMWYGYYSKADGVVWRYVQFKHNGKTYTGFCSSKYLK